MENWEKLEEMERMMLEEKRKVGQEWVKIERKHVALQEKRELFERQVKEKIEFLPEETVVKINVGGQIFSSSVKVWNRDRFSLLARLCTPDPPLKKDSADCFFFDRDWWIFRLIFLFLRDKTLPDSVSDLRELYYEASFYRLALLRQAIEARLLRNEDPELLESNPVPEYYYTKPPPKSKPETAATSVSRHPERPVVPIDHSLPDPFGFTKR